MKCRHCRTDLRHVFVDLATAPPSNAYVAESDLRRPETHYPLRVLVCSNCWLVQTEDYVHAEDLFSPDYAYFSSTSRSWLEHVSAYADDAVARFGLGSQSLLIEVACNDGCLLHYVRERGIPCYGIEPAHSTAEVAREEGVEIIAGFFGEVLANELAEADRRADLIVANNVLAHVPEINDFVRGFSVLLKRDGAASFEFPHLHCLIEGTQFDTIYHEHFSYLSLIAVQQILSANGLSVFDVERLPTHGGSLRVWAQRSDTGSNPVSHSVEELLSFEARVGLNRLEHFQGFQAKADKVKDDFLAYLLNAKREGLKVAAYGAAAKGNTLLNYAGVRADLLPYVVDRSPSKQGKYLPGSHIPILAESQLMRDKPDRVVVLPWNIRSEVMKQLDYIRDWGGRFVLAIPEVSEV